MALLDRHVKAEAAAGRYCQQNRDRRDLGPAFVKRRGNAAQSVEDDVLLIANGD
jgi:hypothetical protein